MIKASEKWSFGKWRIRPTLGMKNRGSRLFIPKSWPPDKGRYRPILQGSRETDFLEEYRPDSPFSKAAY
jgi:hypothetical protein